MKNEFEEMTGEAKKLKLLREADPGRRWRSLDETRHCVLCEQTISGRQIRVSESRNGELEVHCPTPGCPATPVDWIHPGNPLVSEDAWKDWVRLLDTLGEEPEQSGRKPVRRFRPSYEKPVMASSLRLAN